MKLEKIKLSGFKSFVDTTIIPIKGNLISIVGPNGCGKSNIIDAVRWVMGESSAKHLRGGSMADVIFNGSSARKPVSIASVELTFDNSNGELGGEYASYNKIAIKRQINREGQSTYYFNNEKCRRKDIVDLFLGTGLGARSYAIIEQGTISRLVEAKPQELRTHIEEAAGVSKYKERRSETELRMRHTRENLERLQDVRDEVETHLKRLEKQAKKAEQYTDLKAQERRLKSELLVMRWQFYQQATLTSQAHSEQLSLEYNGLFQRHKQDIERLEDKRLQHSLHQQDLDEQQQIFYKQSVAINELEQAIQHTTQLQASTQLEITRLQEQSLQFTHNLADDNAQLDDIKRDLLTADLELEQAQGVEEQQTEQTQAIQQQWAVWQQQWQDYQQQHHGYREKIEGKRVLMSQLEHQRFQIHSRVQRLQTESNSLESTDLRDEIEELKQAIQLQDEHRQQFQAEITTKQTFIVALREQIKQLHDDLHLQRSELQSINGEITALELLQTHALGKDKQPLINWLEGLSLQNNKRLAEGIDVDEKWQVAVEIVLADALEAIYIDDKQGVYEDIALLTDDSLILLSQPEPIDEHKQLHVSLLDKVSCQWDLQGILAGIYCAETLEEAQVLLADLQLHESVITVCGLWLGHGWIKKTGQQNAKVGILQREQQLSALKLRYDSLKISVTAQEADLKAKDEDFKGAEAQRENLQQQEKLLSSELSVEQAALSGHNVRLQQQQQRLAQVMGEMTRLHDEQQDNAEQYEEAMMLKEEAEMAIETLLEHKEHLTATEQQLLTQREQSEALLQASRQQVQSLQAKQSSLTVLQGLTAKQIKRLSLHSQQAEARIAELTATLQTTDKQAMNAERDDLAVLKQSQVTLEQNLSQLRGQHTEADADIQSLSDDINALQHDLETKKDELDSLQLDLQANKVRKQAVEEQSQELNLNLETLIAELSVDANETIWKKNLIKVEQQLSGLGVINLTAIEEYKSQAERMQFLTEQHTDLMEALAILDAAIIKIDQESRQRFKQTFDKINGGLQKKFPQLFGGGKAYLELTDKSALESGVNIIAQPPGKRNSSIHLLSGGEKALTAVALVFSIFELNPAPFCLLDEVDAPLDEANVRRFSDMIVEMSEKVQFLYISHNKVTMEIAEQLTGVTMKEAGVSRMVAVNLQEAVNMAERENG